jgi:proline iminopeptidase
MMSQATKEASSVGYAHSPAYDSGILPVGDIHKIAYEQYGKKDGKPGTFFAPVDNPNP